MFAKNTQALLNPHLKQKLLQIQKQNKFQIIQGEDNLDINLLNIQDNTLMYENTLEELNAMLNTYHEKYFLYPVLYFYGFGNGILYKALLQNQNHKHIIVFENDLELIYTMFQILDFSKELEEARLVIIDTNDLTKRDYDYLCSNNPMFNFSRTYFLELHSNYYEKYQDDILRVNNNLLNSFKNSIFSQGNSPIDALQGIEQFICNIPSMVSNPSYKELINKRKNLSDTAIIVSTGPSLIKQLALLKQYSNKATIFCADSAYPILAKYNIKPDYVCMLERTDFTAEFFNNDFREFDKDIVFVLKSVVHPNTINYLNKKKVYGGGYIIVSNSSNFIVDIKLNAFGYFGMGSSVAHMAHTLATNLNHKNIILIGQDLAYANDGASHPEEYQHSSTYESDTYEHIDTLAYGGKGLVKTHTFWLLFKSIFEDLIASNHIATTYNCTEGGARIEGAIEKPFKEICETLLSKNLHKPFAKLDTLNINKQNELLLKAYYKINQSIKKCVDLKKDFQKEYDLLLGEISLIQHFMDYEANKEVFAKIIDTINTLKDKVEGLRMISSICEVINPLVIQFRLNLARIYVLNPITKEDSFNKTMFWIKEHMEWMSLVVAHINTQKQTLEKSAIDIKEELLNRGFEKLVEKYANENFY
ncbi:motility associated factor glycosyltransferase family protein [Campylobacter insulaenigrae]|uniref:motility associated factor glycosyltransferase family protein n=1 Tax=Campylobacter insulaenigrae TaxID=260714 RepID=UPI0021539E49|nr:motility associated factor glycosyltransferase family protein [Campylobacter insulaenigrae]MCR6572382.1 motility associated factor glycosyltransferase family protein [Campylobacter insulaenigrae]MCR6582101.1 motility associated factor glycosyltransferase family protein [Campylobacter insulaenigrae]